VSIAPDERHSDAGGGGGTGPRAELACRELVELVTAYLEGVIDAAERARFDAHLVGCRGCRAYLQQMRATIRTLGTLSEESLPPGAEQALLRVFRDWNRA
jgi:anti-sigma factor RsiW